MDETKYPSQKYTTLVTFLTALFLVIIVSIWMIGPYLLAVTIAAILALLTQPIYRKLTDKHFGPNLSSSILTLGIIFLIIAPVSVFVSMAATQGIAIGRLAAESELFSPQAMINQVSAWRIFDLMGLSPADISTRTHEWIRTAINTGTSIALHLVALVPEIILQIVLSCASYFFILRDGHRFIRWLGTRIPFDKDVGKRVIVSFTDTAIASVLATVAAGGAQAAVLFFAYMVLGVPGAFLAGGITFIFSWIPILGSTPVWIVGAIYLYAHDSILKLIFMIIFGLAAGLVDNFVRPMVLKGRSDMHPLVSLIAIFGGISFFGIMGVFLGPILVAVMISLLQAWPEVAVRFGLMSKTTPSRAD